MSRRDQPPIKADYLNHITKKGEALPSRPLPATPTEAAARTIPTTTVMMRGEEVRALSTATRPAPATDPHAQPQAQANGVRQRARDQLSVRLPEKTMERLHRLADTSHMTIQFLVTSALDAYLDSWDEPRSSARPPLHSTGRTDA